MFNAIEDLVVSIGITSKEAKAEIEINPLTAEAQVRKCLELCKPFHQFTLLYSSSE